MAGTSREFSDFSTTPFEYDIKKDNRAIRAFLLGRGIINGKNGKIPLSLEKTFSLDGDKSILYFDYTLINTALTPINFKFATELVFSIPGVVSNQAKLKSKSTVYDRLNWDRGVFEDVDKWKITDSRKGVSITFSMDQNCNVWFFPAVSSKTYNGTSIVINRKISLLPNEKVRFSGKISVKKIKITKEAKDVI